MAAATRVPIWGHEPLGVPLAGSWAGTLWQPPCQDEGSSWPMRHSHCSGERGRLGGWRKAPRQVLGWGSRS